MKNENQSLLDPIQMQKHVFDASNDANRVIIVNSDFALAIKDSLKDLKVEVTASQSQQDVQIKEIQVPVIIKEIEIKEVPVIVKETEFREIEKPFTIRELQIVEVEKPVIVKEIQIIEIEKPILIKEKQSPDLVLRILLVLQTLALVAIALHK